MLNSLAEQYHQDFWEELDANKQKVDLHLTRLLAAKGIPREHHTDFLHSIYNVGCVRYSSFDPSRSAFTTWMIWQGRAVVRNYFRGSSGSRNPLGEFKSLTESEVHTLEDEEFSMDKLSDPEALFRDYIDEAILLSGVILDYIKDTANLQDFDEHRAVLLTLVIYDFDVPDRQIAAETELPTKQVAELRADIMGDLGFRLIRKYKYQLNS